MTKDNLDEFRTFDYMQFNKDGSFSGSPRICADGNKPGSYELAIRTIKQTIDPGDVIIFDMYITGYGNIMGNKLNFYPPADFISNGIVKCGIDALVYPNGNMTLKMGYLKIPILSEEQSMFTLSVGGPKFINGQVAQETCFFDVRGDRLEMPSQVTTEMCAGGPSGLSPPFRFELTTKKNVAPGNHSLQIFFTYFNGDFWKTSIGHLDIRIRPLHEIHQLKIALVGMILAILAIIPGYIPKEVGNEQQNDVIESLQKINSSINNINHNSDANKPYFLLNRQ